MEFLVGLGVGAALFVSVIGFCLVMGKLEDWVFRNG